MHTRHSRDVEVDSPPRFLSLEDKRSRKSRSHAADVDVSGNSKKNFREQVETLAPNGRLSSTVGQQVLTVMLLTITAKKDNFLSICSSSFMNNFLIVIVVFVLPDRTVIFPFSNHLFVQHDAIWTVHISDTVGCSYGQIYYPVTFLSILFKNCVGLSALYAHITTTVPDAAPSS